MRFIFLTLALSTLFLGCKDSGSAGAAETEEAAAPIPEISVEEADKALQSGAVAVDANSDVVLQIRPRPAPGRQEQGSDLLLLQHQLHGL
jgi:hypothetical protein